MHRSTGNATQLDVGADIAIKCDPTRPFVPHHDMATAPNDLPPDYYLANFRVLCETAVRQYADLLSSRERGVYRDFLDLDHAAQCLYVRLVSRAGPLFRLDKLRYPEIGDLHPPVAALLHSAFVTEVRQLSTDEMSALYAKPEIRRAFADALTLPASARKREMVDAIRTLGLSDRERFVRLQRWRPHRILGPRHREDVIDLFKLLFFGNREQDLTEFVLSDLGVRRHFPYSLDPEHRLFDDRRAVDSAARCAALHRELQDLITAGDIEGLERLARLVIGEEEPAPTSQLQWNRLRNALGRELERRQQLDLATELYRRSTLHPATERRARILERQQRWPEARALCEGIVSAPTCEAELDAAHRILRRVRRHLRDPEASRRGPDRHSRRSGARCRAGTLAAGAVRPHAPREEQVVLERTDEVELAAAAYYAADWAEVHFVENRLMNALFGLAFWDAIFAPLRGAFVNPFQDVPLDMFDGMFVHRRRELIDARLVHLHECDPRTELLAAYDRCQGFRCRWIDWDRVPRTLVDLAVRSIPRSHLLAVWERQLFDPRANRSGFPDLAAFSSGDYCLIEVKGPGDALNDNQRRWLRFFAGRGIPARVAKVRWRDEPASSSTR